MKDFVQHRLALEQAWADTQILEETEPMRDVNHSPWDDLYSDVTWVTVLMYAFALLYLTFGA